MIIAVGFKVDNERAIQFRKWANQIVKDFTIKGWVMDDERLKNDGSILTKKYFEEQLERIREIRMSERKFYQKITDIYATSIDYDKTAKATIRFFSSVQNKLHYAVSGNTAAEIIYNRADSQKENMGLTSWKGAPDSKIHKYDVVIAKNYLSEKEIGQLERMVSAYLDLAEMQAMRHIPMTMEDWEERLNGFLTLWDHDVLKDNGKISAEMAKHLVDAGVSYIDIEGAGGTSWAAVETYRAEDRYLGETFWDWGIPTAISTVEVADAVDVPVVSSGGIRSGLEAAKAIALGADSVGMALPFLKHSVSEEQLTTFIDRFNDSLRIAMFLVGANNIEELKNSNLVISGKTREWLNERGINTKKYSRR